jgi:hypothetical protein
VGTNRPSRLEIDIKESNKDLGEIISPDKIRSRNKITLNENINT